MMIVAYGQILLRLWQNVRSRTLCSPITLRRGERASEVIWCIGGRGKKCSLFVHETEGGWYIIVPEVETVLLVRVRPPRNHLS